MQILADDWGLRNAKTTLPAFQTVPATQLESIQGMGSCCGALAACDNPEALSTSERQTWDSDSAGTCEREGACTQAGVPCRPTCCLWHIQLLPLMTAQASSGTSLRTCETLALHEVDPWKPSGPHASTRASSFLGTARSAPEGRRTSCPGSCSHDMYTSPMPEVPCGTTCACIQTES